MTKRCPRCTETKPADQFSPDRSKRDGLASKCRPCGAEMSRVYYARNREKKALELDHVRGGGNAHRRRESKYRMYLRIAGQGRLADVELQLLCSPCHKRKTTADRWVAQEMEWAVVG